MLRPLFRKYRQVRDLLHPMQIPLHSAYTAFFLILSLFPSLLLILGLLRFTQLEVSDLTVFLEGFLPEGLYPSALALVQSSYRHSSSALVSVSALAMLWSASRGMYGLLCGLCAVYGQAQAGGYWKKRLYSVVYTFSFFLALLLTLVLHMFGNALLDYLWMKTDPVLMRVMSLIDLRSVLLLLLQTFLFSAIYALPPGAHRRVCKCIPGALLASLGWLLYSRLFSVYMAHFSDYSNIFGSVYALALGMLWLYFCISILFYGAAFNLLREQAQRT